MRAARFGLDPSLVSGPASQAEAHLGNINMRSAVQGTAGRLAERIDKIKHRREKFRTEDDEDQPMET